MGRTIHWELGTDLHLRRAEDLHRVCRSDLVQTLLHCRPGERGRIAIPAQMTQHRPPETVTEQVGHLGSCRSIGKVAVGGHDTLLERPWPAWIVLKHLLIMIGFYNECAGSADPFPGNMGAFPKISQKSQRFSAVVEDETDRIHGIVGNRKRMDADVVDGKVRPRLELTDVRVDGELGLAQNLGGEPGAIHRDRRRFAEDTHSGDMVMMLVGQEDGVEHGRIHSQGGQAQGNLAGAQSGIDEQPASVRFDKGAVPPAATPENRDTEHGG